REGGVVFPRRGRLSRGRVRPAQEPGGFGLAHDLFLEGRGLAGGRSQFLAPFLWRDLSAKPDTGRTARAAGHGRRPSPRGGGRGEVWGRRAPCSTTGSGGFSPAAVPRPIDPLRPVRRRGPGWSALKTGWCPRSPSAAACCRSTARRPAISSASTWM